MAQKVIREKKLAAPAREPAQDEPVVPASPAVVPQQIVQMLKPAFPERSLKRVRSHFTKALDKFGIVLNAEPLNAIALRGIADTLARLEEIERRFSGRGLPANVKPERAGRRDAGAAPMVVDLGEEPDEPTTPQAPSLPASLPPQVGVSLPDLSNLGE